MFHRYMRSTRMTELRTGQPLEDAQIKRFAPTVFAEAPHESRSQRYGFVPTSAVLAGLRNADFLPFEVRRQTVRNNSRLGFEKHLMRFRHRRNIEGFWGGEEYPEIIIINSHDGSSSYQVMSGLFRWVCSNGLITGTVDTDNRIRHKGNVVDDVIEASYRVLDDTQRRMAVLPDWKALQLSDDEQHAFAEAAALLRWDVESTADLPVSPQMVNQPNRLQDAGADLWRTMNRTQENLIRGGLTATRRDAQGRTRRQNTRAVNGIDQSVKLNAALWHLTERMAQLKTAA